MALKPVQDLNLLAALEASETPAPAGAQPVTDPAVLAQLEAPEGPPAETDPVLAGLDRMKPVEPGWRDRMSTPSFWQQFKESGPGSTLLGAPEVIGNTIGNAGNMAVAGLTAPFVSDSMEDAAGYIRDFTSENASDVAAPFGGQTQPARQLTENLGEAFAPAEQIKGGLGDAALDLTGSPEAATLAYMAPDFLSTVLGLPAPLQGAKKLPQTPLKPDPAPVNPAVENMRAADIRLRPSDVRAMEPNKKVKVPGERREKFADAPELKKDTNLHNQARFTDLAAEEIGVKKLDDASFDKAYEAPAGTYDMVEDVLRDREMSQGFADTFREAAASAKLPKGEAYSVTRIIGALRRRAAKRMQAEDVKTEEAGYADRDLAERLEEGLGRELEAAGEPQLFKEYQDARQQYAKIHDTQTATRAGQIDAAVLYKLNQKSEGKRLSGRLKLIADAYENAPNVSSHSLKTAARAGDEIENSKEGFLKSLLKAGIRKIPGMDVGSEGFQKTLGAVDPVRTANYGRRTDLPGPRAPEQAELDIREALGLEMAPGQVGAPARAARSEGAPQDMFGGAFEFEQPPGQVGIPPDPQMTLQELLGLGEPLNLKKPPGRVGKKPSGS
jgi:hypothetical protein